MIAAATLALAWRLLHPFLRRQRVEIVDEVDDGMPSPPRSVARKAEGLSGSYRLSDLERLLQRIDALEAWGVILQLDFTRLGRTTQMRVDRGRLELYCESLEPDETDRFREAARQAGLEARAGFVEGQWCVDVAGTWSEIAGRIGRILVDFHGLDGGEEVEVLVFS